MPVKNIKIKIPKNVIFCLQTLQQKGFEAYIVGGCARDYLRNVKPSDWDIATSAHPEQTQAIFENLNIKTYYENTFGTVGVAFPKNKKGKEPIYEIIEITTFRSEADYTDSRHPNEVKWSKTIEEDLQRRDFTINALALKLNKEQTAPEIIDLFNGQDDLKNQIIRAVRDPKERFSEDALRMLRAIRFKASLGKGWTIEEKTWQAILENKQLLTKISAERIRDELIKIINSPNAATGIEDLRLSGLLSYILPELLEGYGVSQNKHHIFDCYRHNLECLDYSAKKGYSFPVRMAALLHDIGKPRAKRGEGKDATFYNHEIIGAKMTEQIMKRLHFPNKEAEKIVTLVRYHLFYYNVDEVKEASIRRLIKNVGRENMEDLLKIRMADRIGSGCPKAEPYKLRHFQYMIDKVSRDPVSVKMLKVNGQDIMDQLKIGPGPKIGQILDILLEEVLKDPHHNTKKFLKNKIKELSSLSDEELACLAAKARQQKTNVENEINQEIKEKYWVK